MKGKTKDESARAYTEVLEILRHMSKKDVDKIPEDVLNVFKTHCDRTYNYHLDLSKPFEKQAMLHETRVILAMLCSYYWATPEERESLLKIYERNEKKHKLQQYDSLLEESEDA